MRSQRLVLIVLAICVLIFGSSSALSVKGMGSMPPVPPAEGAEPIDFDHTYMTSLFLFVGEACSLIIYGVVKCVRRMRKLSGSSSLMSEKTRFRTCPHTFLFLVPALVDLVGTIMLNFSIYYVIISVQQIISNFVVVIVALLSLMIWKDYRQRFDVPHAIGLILITAGICCASSVSIIFGDDIGTSKNAILGISLGLFGTLFAALCFIFEEIFLRRIYAPGLVGVGNEGLWGLAFNVILIPVMNFIPDPKNPNKTMENTVEWAYQIRHQPIQVLLICSYAISTLLFNVCGMEITRRVSSATRATLNACRAILIWILSLAIGWEKWSTTGSLVIILGHALLILGTLSFNNILRIFPYCRACNIERYGTLCQRRKRATAGTIASSLPSSQKPSRSTSSDALV
ncbi:Transmembrane domain-containing protein [Giardia muris]|uniref:Transmembrane domain-containing protein n=1 Tax=Giardia muris TaxID=5742 RepID=A0A4Z1SSR2_GIAMU|nr:Transmembrane domain-containing protein [Giardia muris]|eukprot:TNJ28904.1 Transmembrane domain-containing protein [Giardia muris]